MKVTTDNSLLQFIRLIKSALNNKANNDHKHTKSQITDMPTSLKNPNTININGVSYDGSAAKDIDLMPFIVGTQTAATSTWTGTASTISSLFDGLTIRYWLPYNSLGDTTLNLTLADGTTTGNINCYYSGTTRLTTHYPAGNIITLTYRSGVSINGSSTKYTGWWADANYFSDTIASARSMTGASTAAKTATCSYYTILSKSYISVLMRYSNTAASALTLNINGQGAKPIYINGSVSSASNYTLPAGSYLVFYDGTNYYFRTDGKLTASITGDAATVNGKTVGVNVPSNAKFTDTTYSVATSTKNGLMSAADKELFDYTNNQLETDLDNLLDSPAESIADIIYPVGSIYMSVNSVNPGALFGGSWAQIAQGRTLFGAGKLNGIKYTAGEEIDAGLPDPQLNLLRRQDSTSSGVYKDIYGTDGYTTSAPSNTGGTDEWMQSMKAMTAANRYMDVVVENPIYGNSETVQPNALVVYIWKRTA